MGREVIEGFEALRALVGVELPPTDWLLVDQARIDAFAACTGDRQWIHVDVERAKHNPYGSTIAHGYLTLALLPELWKDNFEVRGVASVINYGIDWVRFPSPVKSGSRIRARFATLTVRDIDDGLLVKSRATVETEDGKKPACVADILMLYLPLLS